MQDRDFDELVNKFKKESEEEYNGLLQKIKSANARAEDYLSLVSCMNVIYDNPNKEKLNEYYEEAARLAKKQMTSSNMEERASAFVTLAQYNEYKKNYKEALKCYDLAIEAGGKEYLVLRAKLRVQHLNDRKGANRDYELAAQSGMDAEDLKLFEILVKNQQTKTEIMLKLVLPIILIIVSAILLVTATIFYNTVIPQ